VLGDVALDDERLEPVPAARDQSHCRSVGRELTGVAGPPLHLDRGSSSPLAND
jgi:hypothetical protein